MLHHLDRLAHALMQLPCVIPRLFPGGWGDPEALAHFAHERRHPPETKEISISWEPAVEHEGARLGTFPSPGESLPAEASRARVLWFGADHERQVVLLAASNDHGWATRASVAHHLAAVGIGALILENPYYGTRRVQAGQPLPTVADFFRMGSATVAEARALLRYVAEGGHAAGVAGFSQGGSMAAYVSALAPGPVATACMAAGPSPSPVFTAGILSSTVDWTALGGQARALPRLRSMLDDVTVIRYPPTPHAAAAVVSGARRDAYVSPADVERLAAHWPGSELVWLEGGHASFHLFGKRTQAQLIGRAFTRFGRLKSA